MYNKNTITKLLLKHKKGEIIMSLIRCPECSKQVSSTAQSCPNCGFNVVYYVENGKTQPVNDTPSHNTKEIIIDEELEKEIKKEYRPLFVISFLFIIVGFIAGIVFMSKGDERNKFIGKECIGWACSALVFEMIIGFIYGFLLFFGIV